MKKILLLALPLMAMCAVSCEKWKDDSQIIHFKDPSFLKAVLELVFDFESIDRNGDGRISEKEASVVESLDVGSDGIEYLDEIKYFTALTYLDCSFNQLTALNVGFNFALTYLDCSFNQLTSLDLSNNTALTDLNCYENQLTSLDLSNNTALTDLYCRDNQLTSLDLSNNTALTDLNCSYNQLTSLDLSNNTALTYLNCYDNQLTKIILPRNHSLDDYWIQEIINEYGDIIEYR